VLRVAVGMVALSLTGCFKVAEAPADEMPKLSGHTAGRPEVKIRTLDGDEVEIDGEFKEVRVIVGYDWQQQVRIVRPPFVAEKSGDDLRYASSGSQTTKIDAAEVQRIEVVQRDGARTWTVLGVGVGATLVGAVLGAYLEERGRDKTTPRSSCGGCGAAAGMIVLGGAGFLLVVPLTKYY